MPDLNLTVNPEGDTLKVLQGQAPPPDPAQSQDISGKITAPANYFTVKQENIDPLRDHVEVERKENPYIKLIINPAHDAKIVVTGRLKISKPVNSIFDKRMGPIHLGELLRRNSRYLANESKGAKMITFLKKFSATVTNIYESEENQVGKRRRLIDTSVQTEIPNDGLLDLKMPVLEGGEELQLTGSICYQAKDDGVLFWVENLKLEELIEERSSMLIDEELKKIHGLTIIEK